MRNSSIELFRIIAMFFVVVVHCNGWLVGGIPDSFDESNISIFRVSQALIQAITCTCVNMFLLISGWFGLKLKWKSILSIYLTLVFISIPFYLFSCCIGEVFSIKGILYRFQAISRSGYFVEGYLLLMFFSPVFNAFIEKLGKNIILWVCLFWAIEFYFEFLIHDSDLGFNEGYSFIHFVLIYMIGRTLHLYQYKLIPISSLKYLAVYICSTLIILGMYMAFDLESIYFYSSPANIVAASCLFLLFAKRSFYNNWINWIASSTFAVYIIHTTQPVLNWLRQFDMATLENNPYHFYLSTMGGVIILIFIGSILYDKIIKLFIKPVVRILEVKTHRFNENLFS